MNGIVSDLEQFEIKAIRKSYKIILTRKLSRGVEMTDIRLWKKWAQDGVFHPGSNGLMIETSILKDILPEINRRILAST